LTMFTAEGAKSHAYTNSRESGCCVSKGKTVLPAPQPTSSTVNYASLGQEKKW